jgi:hypothetical protein
MCELLKVEILIPQILDVCVAKLVKSPKEIPLECLCIILKHVGKEIDHVIIITDSSDIAYITIRFYSIKLLYNEKNLPISVQCVRKALRVLVRVQVEIVGKDTVYDPRHYRSEE